MNRKLMDTVSGYIPFIKLGLDDARVKSCYSSLDTQSVSASENYDQTECHKTNIVLSLI